LLIPPRFRPTTAEPLFCGRRVDAGLTGGAREANVTERAWGNKSSMESPMPPLDNGEESDTAEEASNALE
jgi:hypothetical protein